jgi:hypothetical protein
MTTLKHILTIFILTPFFGCNNTTTTKTESNKSDRISVDTVNTLSKVTDDTQFNAEELADSITQIKFSDFTLTINRLVVWDEKKALDKIQKDTVSLYVELGETIEGQSISIETNKWTDIKVEQRYETSVTIMNEGPHCDLTNWKHYYSEWRQLSKNDNGNFICNKYEERDWEKFPKIDINELKEQVKKQCGDTWFYLVKSVKTPTEYPSGVSISRYFLRIIGRDKNNGELITKIIILESPMGC